jgi:hypothetical protein
MIREEEFKKEEALIDDCKDNLAKEGDKEKELLHMRERDVKAQ